MAIGEEQAALCCDPELKRGAIKKLLMWAYCRGYGHPDLHTHIRWRALKPILSDGSFRGRPTVLEIGCSSGVMSFAVARQHRNVSIIAVDADEAAIRTAEKARSQNDVSNIDFRVLRVPGLESFADGTFDVVLLIDVIEHVVEDTILMKEIGRILKPGGKVIVSAPTPNYPRVFGRRFHELVGHMRDGYWKGNLQAVLSNAGFNEMQCKPYTYPPSAVACFVFYRWFINMQSLASFFSPLLNLFSWLDFVWPVRKERLACSLAMVAIKQG